MTPYENPDYWALVRGIREIDRAGGDSTVARLVTADWLQDHGEEARAEFVRATAVDANWQYSASVSTIAAYWPVADLPPAAVGVAGQLFAGFLRWVCCPIACWVAHGPDVVRRHPVRSLIITDRTPFRGSLRGNGSPDYPSWLWVRQSNPIAGGRAHAVPDDIWERLPDEGRIPPWSPRDVARRYRTSVLAAQALNAAALAWAEAVADVTDEK